MLENCRRTPIGVLSDPLNRVLVWAMWRARSWCRGWPLVVSAESITGSMMRGQATQGVNGQLLSRQRHLVSYSGEAGVTRRCKGKAVHSWDQWGRKADGRDWDGPGAGAPDPFVVVAFVSYRSARCEDTYRCAFRVLAGDGDFRVDVYDADAMGDDWAGATICSSGAVCDTEAARVIVGR